MGGSRLLTRCVLGVSHEDVLVEGAEEEHEGAVEELLGLRGGLGRLRERVLQPLQLLKKCLRPIKQMNLHHSGAQWGLTMTFHKN